MIRVGFIVNFSNEWIGGVNYLKNLLYAINFLTNNDKKIYPIIFIAKNTNNNYVKPFTELAEVIEVPFLDKKSIRYLIWKTVKKLFGSDYVLELLLKKYNIDIFSHSNLFGMKNIKAVNWIPDFQHIHLSNMFSESSIKERNSSFKLLIKKSDLIILSSFDAFNDYNNFISGYSYKARVLHFVAQPNRKIFKISRKAIKDILIKFNINNFYFFLPNQFWKHKNHLIVLEALKNLKEEGYDIPLVCSGHMNDARHINHIKMINEFIVLNKLNVILLGLIDYDEVITLMKGSIAVINPSLFEGWSSTVEECKSISKNLILSDIKVHREQNPQNCIYFNPESVDELKQAILTKWFSKDIKTVSSNDIRGNLELKTIEFAKEYQNIIIEVIQKKSLYKHL